VDKKSVVKDRKRWRRRENDSERRKWGKKEA